MSFTPRVQPWALVESRMHNLQRTLGKDVCDRMAQCTDYKDATRLQAVLHDQGLSNNRGRAGAVLGMMLAQLRRESDAVEMVRGV
jgi:hypothetical protein